MRLGLCEGRSAVSERVVSVESDPETLGRAGREGEQASGSTEDVLLRCDYRVRRRTQGGRYPLTYREAEGYARSSTFTRAVATASRSPVMRMARMFGARPMLRGHAVGVGMTCCSPGAMHRTGYDGSCCASQRRDPRC
jgi:hypothetical protein